MKKNKLYTPDGRHPEDAIFFTRTFINELSKVRETYYQRLVNDLNLNAEGEEYLFDYIHNSGDEGDRMDFSEWLAEHGKMYEDFCSK